MQPVQYRGHAQGTAFNPIIFSDQSRKILEQNEQFLRGLQAKQQIERDFEVAKLKQLQQNITSQRQQLNENFGYDQRVRDRYNQSLNENAAREVQDLKRIAALQPDKPSTAAVVNDVANFLVGASQTAAKVIGQVKENRIAQDKAASDAVSAMGDGVINAYTGMQIGGQVIVDTANNAIAATFATAKAFKESGYQLQEGQKLLDIRAGVQANLNFTQAQQGIKNLPLEFQAQKEYKFNGQTLTRAEFQQLDAKDQKAALEQKFAEVLEPFEGRFSQTLFQQLKSSSGEKVSEYYGQQLKKQAEVIDGQVVEAALLKANTLGRPEDYQAYINTVAIYEGGDRAKAVAKFAELAKDSTAMTSARYNAFRNTTFVDQLGNESTFALRNAVTDQEILKARAKDEVAKEKQFEDKRELAELGMIKSFHEAFDQDRRDGTLDDASSQQLAEEAKRAEANGYTKFATLLRSNIKITADHKLLEEQRKKLDALYANAGLDERHVRDSGLQGQEFVDYMEKARESRAVVAPTKENLDEATSRIESDLNRRVTGGAAYSGKLPAKYYTGRRREIDRYVKAYRNEMRKSGDHATAHNVGMGAVEAVIGTDPTKGLYRVGSTLEEIRSQIAKGGIPGDFLDESLAYKPIDVSNTSNINQIRQRIEDLGIKAVPSLVSVKNLSTTFDAYQATGKITRIPSLEVAAKELNQPYAKLHNFAATELKEDSLKLPKKLYDDAIEIENAARNNTPWGKFLNSRANLEQSVITPLVVTALSGAPYAMSASAQVLTATAQKRPEADSLINYMVNDKKMSSNHAMGLVINQMRESSLRFGDDTIITDVNGKTSGGSFQWNGPRYQRMREVLGDNWTDPKAQIDYALSEKGEPGQEYLNTTFATPLDAANWWMRNWERTADPARDMQKHQAILQQLQGAN